MAIARLTKLAAQLGIAALGVFLGAHAGWADQALPRTAAPAGAAVYFISPAEGATVDSPVTVQFGLTGMGVAPAGVVREATGHHHVIIDASPPDTSLPIPSDAQHRHFGGGQTETSLELAPGAHTLQLILGDASHIPHEPPVVSERISITVK